MKSMVANVWNGLWNSHRQTKNLLNVFSYQKGSAAKAANASATNAREGQSMQPQNNDNEPKNSYSKAQMIGLILGPALFLLTILFFSPEGLSFEARAVLAITLWVATWWITEAIPIPATSILPIFLLPITGALDGGTVTSAYGDDIIFLFLGGFFIATAMEKWNLHKRMALAIIAFIGTSTQRILLGFMIATAFLSMWVSNTAAVMMMVPMGLAITAQVAAALKGKPEERDLPKFEKALIFGVGYAGTIGGLGTLIGTPPNIILAAQAQQLFDVEISFARWMMVGVPVVILLLVSAWMYLGRVAFKMSITGLPGGKNLIQSERSKLGKTSFEEKAVAAVFSFAAFMWISREFIWVDLVPELRDGMIAVLAAVMLFVIPTSRKFGSRILEWKDSRDIPWGVLLLFGGGLAIAAGFRETGLSDWMGTQLTVLDGLHLIVMIAATALFVLFLTEITSNTATATMIIPVVASLALALNIHPFALMIPCAMAANCAFMLPVGTPPNAIIFGTGKLKIIEMVRVGFLVNLIAAVLIVLAVYFMVPLFWGIDLNVVPAGFSL
ncbi:sodium:dicarboxylate cotransporter DASS family [Alkalihalophilus pseudofirmus OF4]|uniref:Sodium-dependent dicarboxylate transporter SdcS n=1 Tax=Alkalihalophilus pseudofirmus (strain ATCC BAA-2126 / JCM 17055 / OF4) TaxID=398511 RepID=D3FYE4_ALKPO|nr:SLC13 family permease [Alkalihalophilus pseudofirmus]ADC49167.1 sodium:dicarboxylate cotransporter DASS family [Alkalihalophilus pseudofirmus OF4]